MLHNVDGGRDLLRLLFVAGVDHGVEHVLDMLCQLVSTVGCVIEHLGAMDRRMARQSVLVDAQKRSVCVAVDKFDAVLRVGHLLLADGGGVGIAEGLLPRARHADAFAQEKAYLIGFLGDRQVQIALQHTAGGTGPAVHTAVASVDDEHMGFLHHDR